MNWQLLGHLLRLRYKLMWAMRRTRGGKITLFVVGYLLLILLLVLFSMGGFGAGMAAVRMGKAEVVAQVVLSALFFQAVLSTLMLGFGISAVFSENQLRRYPLTATERRVARHLTAILDPFWFLVLALELGLLVGLYGMGVAPFWAGVAAVMLLIVSNYLLARSMALAVERLMMRSWGSVVLMAAVLGLSVLPGTLVQLLRKNHTLLAGILAALHYSPAFAAAAALTGRPAGLVVVLFWTVGFAALVLALERQPLERRRAVLEGPLDWSGYYERAGGLFGASNAPLVGQWLRFYLRNNRFRALSVLAIPLACFLTFQLGGRASGPGYFVAALGTFPIVSFMGTSRIAVNLFGYMGGGMRRLFLLPIDPAASLRAGSYASVLLGAGALTLAALVWLLLAPVPFDPRRLAMLLASGTAGLFLFHGGGLWATLYGARRGNYTSSLGNDMSLAGNLLTIGGMMSAILLPQVLVRRDPELFSLDRWWLWLAPMAAALTFYVISLLTAGALFVGRRERLMALVEGK